MKKLVYISGKYSDTRGPAFIQQNIDIARKAAMMLWSLGVPNICPHLNTQFFDGIVSYNTFIQGDLLMIERSDGIVMLPGWTQSPGAVKEYNYSKELDKEIFYYDSLKTSPDHLVVFLDWVHDGNEVDVDIFVTNAMEQRFINEECFEYIKKTCGCPSS